MLIHRNFDSLPPIRRPAATIGSYDGVHAGHRAILGRIADIARELEAARKKNKLVIMDFAGDGQDIIEISDEDASLIRQLVKSFTERRKTDTE